MHEVDVYSAGLLCRTERCIKRIYTAPYNCKVCRYIPLQKLKVWLFKIHKKLPPPSLGRIVMCNFRIKLPFALDYKFTRAYRHPSKKTHLLNHYQQMTSTTLLLPNTDTYLLTHPYGRKSDANLFRNSASTRPRKLV